MTGKLFADAVTTAMYSSVSTLKEEQKYLIDKGLNSTIESSQYYLAGASFFTQALGGTAIGIIAGLATALISRATTYCRGTAMMVLITGA